MPKHKPTRIALLEAFDFEVSQMLRADVLFDFNMQFYTFRFNYTRAGLPLDELNARAIRLFGPEEQARDLCWRQALHVAQRRYGLPLEIVQIIYTAIVTSDRAYQSRHYELSPFRHDHIPDPTQQRHVPPLFHHQRQGKRRHPQLGRVEITEDGALRMRRPHLTKTSSDHDFISAVRQREGRPDAAAQRSLRIQTVNRLFVVNPDAVGSATSACSLILRIVEMKAVSAGGFRYPYPPQKSVVKTSYVALPNNASIQDLFAHVSKLAAGSKNRQVPLSEDMSLLVGDHRIWDAVNEVFRKHTWMFSDGYSKYRPLQDQYSRLAQDLRSCYHNAPAHLVDRGEALLSELDAVLDQHVSMRLDFIKRDGSNGSGAAVYDGLGLDKQGAAIVCGSRRHLVEHLRDQTKRNALPKDCVNIERGVPLHKIHWYHASIQDVLPTAGQAYTPAEGCQPPRGNDVKDVFTQIDCRRDEVMDGWGGPRVVPCEITFHIECLGRGRRLPRDAYPVVLSKTAVDQYVPLW